MREIKFRGIKRNPYGDKWVYGYYALKDGEHIIIMPHSTSYEKGLKENKPLPTISVEHNVDYNTIGQYTELKDKNGKEIYEGDVVEGRVGNEEGFDVKGIVVYCGCGYYFIKDKDDEVMIHIINNLEVIGNIYDNP